MNISPLSLEDVAGCATRATALFESGFNCAEAVFQAVAGATGADVSGMVRLATVLGGGMGRTHEEACGILSGGLLAVGFFLGRDAAHSNWDSAAEVGAEYRARFAEDCGGTRCNDVLANFGEQENYARCKSMAGTMAGVLAELLAGVGEAAVSSSTRCDCGR